MVYNSDNTAALSGDVRLPNGQGKSTLLTATPAMAKMSATGREVAVRTVLLRTREVPPVSFPSFHCYHIPLFVHPCLASCPSGGRAILLARCRPPPAAALRRLSRYPWRLGRLQLRDRHELGRQRTSRGPGRPVRKFAGAEAPGDADGGSRHADEWGPAAFRDPAPAGLDSSRRTRQLIRSAYSRDHRVQRPTGIPSAVARPRRSPRDLSLRWEEQKPGRGHWIM